jgi:Sec-independent protein secretion pathway component TatC
VISQTLLAVPVYLLYELGILMSKLFVRQRSSKPDEAVAAED